MSLEKVYLSREGLSEVNKLHAFFSSIIIKNESEANLYETATSASEYRLYAAAYSNAASVYDYNYSVADLQSFFTSAEISLYDLTDPINLFKLYNDGNTRAVSFISHIETKLVEGYEEKNNYYRTFCGLPPDSSYFIWVKDLDAVDDDAKILIHEIYLNTNPLTYEFYFIKDEYTTLFDAYPTHDYLRFLKNKKTPYYVRSLPNFSLVYCDESILSDSEYARFERAYTKAQVYIMGQTFISGMSERYENYYKIQLSLMMMSLMTNYFNESVRNYSLRNYTKFELWDILDSAGLSNLKAISDLDLLHLIVFKLNTLKKYRGSEDIITILYEMINDPSLAIKRYNIVKRYSTDENGYLKFDLRKPFNELVELLLEEELISSKTNENSIVSTKELDFDTFVRYDDLWGGDMSDVSIENRTELQAAIKNQIIKMDFTKLKTKYLILSKSFNAYTATEELNNMMYLVMKFSTESETAVSVNAFKSAEVLFKDIITTPHALFVALKYVENLIDNIHYQGSATPAFSGNPDIISDAVINRSYINTVYNLQYSDGLLGVDGLMSTLYKTVIGPNSEDVEIEWPRDRNILNKITIKDILEEFHDKEDMDISDTTLYQSLVKYPRPDYTTIGDIIDDFENNKTIIAKVCKHLMASADYRDYLLWDKIYNVNVKHYSYGHVYDKPGGESRFETFSECLEYLNPAMYKFIESSLAIGYDTFIEYHNALYEVHKLLTIGVKEWVTSYIETKYDLTTNASNTNISYLEDLKLLFSEFLSIYLELYDVENTYAMSDEPFNRYAIYYLKTSEMSKDAFDEYIAFSMRNSKSTQNLKITDDTKMWFTRNGDIMSDSHKDRMDVMYMINKFYLKNRLDDNLKIDYGKHESIKDIYMDTMGVRETINTLEEKKINE